MATAVSASTYSTNYDPDFQAFREYEASRNQAPGSGILPDGWPRTINGPEAWAAGDIGESFIWKLSESHFTEIDLACKAFIATGKPLSMITRQTFPLPTLSRELASWRQNLHTGNGIALFRGFNPDCYSRKENVVIFAGLSAYMSQRRGFQAAGKILGTSVSASKLKKPKNSNLTAHIRDLSKIAPTSLSVAPYTNIKLPFHTDYGDVLSMMVLGTAADEGNGLLASVATIYNAIATTRPDILSVLGTPDWPFDRPVNGELYELRPVLYVVNGKPEMQFSRGGLMRSKASQRMTTMPLLSAEQSEALDMVHFTAKAHALSIVWEKGDVLFFNNRKVLHGRDAFRDSEESHEARHFLRLWLQDEQLAGPPPQHLEARWNHVFRSLGGETDREADEDRWPLEPSSKAQEILSRRG